MGAYTDDTVFDEVSPGVRVDQFLATRLEGYSRNQIQQWIKEGRVLVNNGKPKASYRLEDGDVIHVVVPLPVSTVIEPEDIPLTVLYEDSSMVIVDKPAGMVVHPAFGNLTGTLVHAALRRWPEMAQAGPSGRQGIVHRLDKGTSGVMVLAKTQAALSDLQAQFKNRSIEKLYIALLEGIPTSSTGIIDAPIGRNPKQRQRLSVMYEGRQALTRYNVTEVFDKNVLVDLVPETGRTHQIRVHLAWIGHPVVGDTVYGFRKQRLRLNRLFLHAGRLAVTSPSSGERIIAESPMPPALEAILKHLREYQR